MNNLKQSYVLSIASLQQSNHKTVQTIFKVSILTLEGSEHLRLILPRDTSFCRRISQANLFSLSTQASVEIYTHDLTILNTRGRKQGGEINQVLEIN